MSLTKRSRELDDNPIDPHTPAPTGRRLYVIFDDWPWGYSIYDLNLWPGSTAGAKLRRLPPPFIRLEAPRGAPWLFASIGSRIVATHPRGNFRDSVPDGFQPIIDVRSRAINFGPGHVFLGLPIFFSVGDDEVYSVDTGGFKTLSLRPLAPPRLEHKSKCRDVWSWCDLPEPPFTRFEVTSYAKDHDGKTLLVSTSTATFAFDTVGPRVWKQYADWPLPFAGRAHFTRNLGALVGLSKDPDTLGHLCFCKVVDGRPMCGFSKEKLLSEDPAEDHAGATLAFLGESSKEAQFCLVQCICSGGVQEQLEVKGDNMAGDMQCASTGESIADLKPHKMPLDGKEVPRCISYFYRLTTFSLGYDNNGDLTTGQSCQVQCYKIPEGITQTSFLMDPVVFWL